MTNISTKSVSLTWNPPTILNGVVLYIVFYSNLDDWETAVTFLKVRRDTYVEILNLEEYILYKFVEQPFTKTGGIGMINSIEVRTKPSGKEPTLKL